jgi:hypothetical protein
MTFGSHREPDKTQHHQYRRKRQQRIPSQWSERELGPIAARTFQLEQNHDVNCVYKRCSGASAAWS